MVDRRLFSHDPGTGITRWFEYDHTDDHFSIITEQDVNPIIEATKQDYNNAPQRWSDLSRVANIPMTVYYDLLRRGILHDQKKMKQWLNDPDNRFFRTRPGRI